MVRVGSRPWARVIGLLLLVSSLAGCVYIFRVVRTDPVDFRADSVLIQSPAKAHLRDGSTLVYRNGAEVVRDTLRGVAIRYDIGTAPASATAVESRVPVDSIVAMESFSTHVNGSKSVLVSGGATALFIGVLAAIWVATSCPTVYSDSAGVMTLDAEPFPNSVTPLFEQRDVQRLHAQPDAKGIVRLEVRNDAMETHDFNHVELLEVRHEANEQAMPDWSSPNHRLVAVSGLRHLTFAEDRAGRDVRSAILDDDTLVFRTATATIDAARVDDFTDHIDIALPAPVDVDSAALVFTMKNSLMTTMLLYDMMLAERGWRSLDWLSEDMARIGQAVELGKWYSSRMGMNIAVWRDGRWEQTAHVPNVGPIAWRRVAAIVPVPPGDTLRLRLSFVADQWRIGSVGVAAHVRPVSARHIPPREVIASTGDANADALRDIRRPDGRYLETSPGEHFQLTFDAGTTTTLGTTPSTRTFMLASQGFYTEWLRTEWIRAARTTTPFQPNDSTLVAALRRWRVAKDSLERQIGDPLGAPPPRPARAAGQRSDR